MTDTHDKLREAVARAIDACDPDRIDHALCLKQADAALSLMQPEIDRRVAEERARLLEKLREPSEGMIEEGWKHIPANDSDGGDIRNAWQAMLAAFEQDNNNQTCAHDWKYTGTDPRGSHKGEHAYRCSRCKVFEYRAGE